MSAPVAVLDRPRRERGEGGGVGPVTGRRVVRSEWIKLVTLRSTIMVSALTAALMVVMGLLLPYLDWQSTPVDQRLGFDSITRSLAGVHLAVLTVGILGVLVVSGEYATGMIRATLGAVPRRLPVLWAKLAVFAPVTFVLSLCSALVAFLGGQALLGSHGASLGSPGALRAVFGVALFLTVMGMLGVALGFLIRSTAGGIAAVVGLTFVLVGLGEALPASWQTSVVPYFPYQAGQAVYTLHHGANMLAPWPGFALFCGYTAVAIAAAAFALRRRDA